MSRGPGVIQRAVERYLAERPRQHAVQRADGSERRVLHWSDWEDIWVLACAAYHGHPGSNECAEVTRAELEAARRAVKRLEARGVAETAVRRPDFGRQRVLMVRPALTDAERDAEGDWETQRMREHIELLSKLQHRDGSIRQTVEREEADERDE